ncbi:CRAL-TRIO domain-containing protein [Phyllosticta citricarpa]|uniref:CRAL-TRIO domain-containing protein n=1 Tax=Phyllosticta citricarpa TaxID=55181 RepID=A0ABR1MDW9_9PEZI
MPQDNASAELSRFDSYQYPAAHLGHLTANQESALDKFKELCKDAGYYRPAGVDDKKIPSHDDETMLRYLRARKFSPADALKQFKETEDWRKENRLDNLYDTIDVKEYDETRRLYPQWTGRRDKRGIPVYLFEVAHLNSKNIAAYEASQKKADGGNTTKDRKVPGKLLRLFALYENLTRFVMPLCSAMPDRGHPETPISQSNNIVDISKVGLKQFWNLKNHMQDASQLATAHYPETLDRIFIIGAPAFFPTVWSWIKRWFDPITVSKIFILTNSNMKDTLEKYIDPENIPKRYGGKLDYDFSQLPNLEPSIAERLEFINSAKQDGKDTFPTGPIKWEETSDGLIQAIAVGSEGGQPRRQVVASLHAPNTSLKAMHGSAVAGATPLIEKGDPMETTTGTYTQPAVDPNAELVETPPSDSPRSGNSAINLPDRTVEARTGTSEARLAGQNGTHAEGQLADGTPHDAVNDHGHGDKTVTMEPNTVGQAAKDVPETKTGEEGKRKSLVDQAKDTAETVAASVGLVNGKKKGEDAENTAATAEDERVDKMQDKQVEGYLREQTMSKA